MNTSIGSQDNTNAQKAGALEGSVTGLMLMHAEGLAREYETVEARRARASEMLADVTNELARATDARKEYEARVRIALKEERCNWSREDIDDALLHNEEYKELVLLERNLEQQRIELQTDVSNWERRAAMISRFIELRRQEIELSRTGHNLANRRPPRERIRSSRK